MGRTKRGLGEEPENTGYMCEIVKDENLVTKIF